MHLGHAYAAKVAHDLARTAGGSFLLRIEDIDRARSKPKWENAIYDDLSWIGLNWDSPVIRQSDRLNTYNVGLLRLAEMGLLYPCRCRRADIQSALSAPQEGAAMFGPDGVIYPGLCRNRELQDADPDDVLRLDIRKAISKLGHGAKLGFFETGPIHEGEHVLDIGSIPQTIGDVVLARRDMGTSYHLSVVLDDAEQNVSLVTRGADLFSATPLHRILQALFDLPIPVYHHHKLLRDDKGKRLAKRDDAKALSTYRSAGESAVDIWSRVTAAAKF